MQFNYQGHSLKPGIYKLLNTTNGRFYIGSCRRFKERWKEHVNSLIKQKHNNKFLLNDFNKCGSEAFVFEVVEVFEGTREERLAREQFYIDQFHDNQQQCYNLRKIANSSQGSKPKDPLLTRLRNRNAAKMRWVANPELGRNLHESQKLFYKTNPKRKQEVCAMGGSKTFKSIQLKNPLDEVVIITNITKFAKEHGLNQSALSAVASGKQSWYRGWITVDGNREQIESEPTILQTNEYKLYLSNRTKISWLNEATKQQRMIGIKRFWDNCQGQERQQKIANQAKAVALHNAKTYHLIDPNGNFVTITNLTSFCKNSEMLDYQSMSAVANGRKQSYKGWKKQQAFQHENNR